MDKIKTVKIKNEDGSVSQESYYISADARCIDMANGYDLQETIGTIDIENSGSIEEQLNNLDIEIKKKAYFFNTVANMKTANLKIGDYVCTLGYYEVNDGGSGTYQIIDDNTLVDDGGSIHNLVNGNKAKLIIENNKINIRQFGVYGDGTHDDTQAIQNAVNLGLETYFPRGNYLISESINLPFNIKVYGENRSNTVIESTINQDYIFYYGTQYTYIDYKGEISYLRFRTKENQENKSKGIFLNSGCNIHDCEFYKLSTAINCSTSYIDLIEIVNCAVNYCVPYNNEYIINFGGNGDGLFINKLKMVNYANDTTQYNGLYIDKCHGGSINNSIINAKITLNHTNGFSINNTHIENLDSVIYIKDSNVSLNNIFKFKNSVLNDIIIETTDYGFFNSITLNNIVFARKGDNFEETYSNEISEIPINTEITISNCYSLINLADLGSTSHICYGINIQNFEEFNILSGIYSKFSHIAYSKKINSIVQFDRPSVSTLGNPALNTRTTWRGENYSSLNYRAVIIVDEARKIICGYSSNSSISDVVADGSGISIPINNNTYNKDIYLYCGSSLDNYNKRIKINIPNRTRLLDNGLICGNKSWETVESTNGRTGYINPERVEKIGDNVTIYHTTTPTVGTWKKFDKVINTNTASGQVISWIFNGTDWIAQGTY